MSQNSRISITGRNVIIALLIAFVVTFVLTLIYSSMASFLNFNTKADVDILAVINHLGQTFASLFKPVGICAAPIVFIIAFALLQRFRLQKLIEKEADGTEEGKES